MKLSIKKIGLILCLMLTGIWNSFAQYSIEYVYDASGNRISRTVITLKAPTTKSAKFSDSFAEEKQDEISPFEEIFGEQKISIYPNPTKGRLVIGISGGDPKEDFNLHLFDVNGRMVLRDQIKAAGEVPVNMHHLDAGIYILVLQNAQKKKTYKIVKE